MCNVCKAGRVNPGSLMEIIIHLEVPEQGSREQAAPPKRTPCSKKEGPARPVLFKILAQL